MLLGISFLRKRRQSWRMMSGKIISLVGMLAEC